jgi:hypothetical protein
MQCCVGKCINIICCKYLELLSEVQHCACCDISCVEKKSRSVDVFYVLLPGTFCGIMLLSKVGMDVWFFKHICWML